jgi:nucleoside-diphosphate-sugar epimerase
MTRVLVTGCAGFIGSHLAERCVREGFAVRGIDAFTSYYDRDLKLKNLDGLLKAPSFEMTVDCLTHADLPKLLEGVDVVYHLAAQPGVGASWEDFGAYTRHNVDALQHLLDGCVRAGTPRFVFASSSSVYGDSLQAPTSEGAPLQPLSPYGATKMLGERLCEIYKISYGLPTVKLRYFTVYGPRQRPDMAFTRFIRAALAGEEVHLYGDGRQTRDFTFVDDAVSATVEASLIEFPERTYNIGGENVASVNDALETIEETVGRRIDIRYFPRQRGDVRATCADPFLAQRDLGFTCTRSLERGLAEQVKWITDTMIERKHDDRR